MTHNTQSASSELSEAKERTIASFAHFGGILGFLPPPRSISSTAGVAQGSLSKRRVKRWTLLRSQYRHSCFYGGQSDPEHRECCFTRCRARLDFHGDWGNAWRVESV